MSAKGFGFDRVLPELKAGAKIRRKGWNGKGMHLELQVPDENSKMTLPYIFLVTPNERTDGLLDRVPWLASQTDLLAEDWQYLLDDYTGYTYTYDPLAAQLSEPRDHQPATMATQELLDDMLEHQTAQAYTLGDLPTGTIIDGLITVDDMPPVSGMQRMHLMSDDCWCMPRVEDIVIPRSTGDPHRRRTHFSEGTIMAGPANQGAAYDAMLTERIRAAAANDAAHKAGRRELPKDPPPGTVHGGTY